MLGKKLFLAGCCIGILIFTFALAVADPLPPPPVPTICPMVQCMVIDSAKLVGSAPLGDTYDVFFTTLNWFNTTADAGVDEIQILPTVPSQQQSFLVAAGPPGGWEVVAVAVNGVYFKASTPADKISEAGLCDACAPASCGNKKGEFRLRVAQLLPGDCFTAQWKHLSGGVDNGDNMNFGSMSWCYNGSGSFTEQYSNVPYDQRYMSLKVPSLTTYGLIALALLLTGTAVWMFRKRRVSVA